MDNYSWQYLMCQSRYNQITLYMQKNAKICLHVFTICIICNKYPGDTEIFPVCAASTWATGSEIWSHSSGKNCGISGLYMESSKKPSWEVTSVGILVAKVSALCALSKFWADDCQGALSWPNENGVVSYPVGRVSGQKSPPSAGVITTARAYPGVQYLLQ
jgi:hypothetical protein